MSEQEWRERAETAEAKLSTQEQAFHMSIDRVKQFKGNLGVRERDNGEIIIDFQKFVKGLGVGGCLELRREIDLQYGISGEPGKKPHMRLVADGGSK